MFDKIKTNHKIFSRYFHKGLEVYLCLFGLFTFFIGIDDLISILKIYIKNENIIFLKIALFAIIIVSSIVVLLIIAAVLTFIKRKEVIIKGKLQVEYGDIFNLNNSKNIIVVIPVNSTFDVIVDDVSVPKPLVSINTLHGQFLNKNVNEENRDEVNNVIQKNLIDNEYKVANLLQKQRGNNKEYPIGTIAIYPIKKINYFLLAISSFDKNNNAHCNKKDIINATISLINKYDKNGQGYDLYVPLFGTGLSRSGLEDEKESLKILTTIFSLYSNEYKGKVHIVVYNKNSNITPLI